MFIHWLILGHVTFVLAQEFTCPTCAGLHPDPYDCTMYYQCDELCQAFHRSCPDGLHFNNFTKTCDWPWTANCRPLTTPAPSTVPPTGPATTEPIMTSPPPGSPEPTLAPETAVGFMAYLENVRYVLLNPVYFDGVDPNLNSWMQEFNRLFVPSDGIYYFSLSAAGMTSETIDFALSVSGERRASVKRTANDHLDADTTSRDYITRLIAGQNVHAVSTSAVLYSDYELQTSLSGFSVTQMAGPGNEVVFYVANNVSWTGGAQIPFQYNNVLINQYGGYDQITHRYTAPFDGAYYLHLSAGHNEAMELDLIIRVNFVPFVSLYRNSTNHNGIDTTSRGALTSLLAGDVVDVVNNQGSSTYSDPELQTSFGGFLINPMADFVGWFVARTTSWTGESSSMYPVVFDDIVFSFGPRLPWDPVENRANIPRTGYYFLHISTGTMPNFGVNYSLTRNDAVYIDILRRFPHQDEGMDTISRSAVAFLLQDEFLKLGAGQGTAMFSNLGRQTSFSGFLIYG